MLGGNNEATKHLSAPVSIARAFSFPVAIPKHTYSVQPHTIHRPKPTLGNSAATQVGFFGTLARENYFASQASRATPSSSRTRVDPSFEAYETKVRVVWGSFLIAAAAPKTPTRTGCNAQGVNLTFASQVSRAVASSSRVKG